MWLGSLRQEGAGREACGPRWVNEALGIPRQRLRCGIVKSLSWVPRPLGAAEGSLLGREQDFGGGSMRSLVGIFRPWSIPSSQ